jgi:hydrogenase maturation protein HypF
VQPAAATLPRARRDERCAVRVRGAVQGVGFRPFVHRLARDLALAGWVRNDAEGVAIEVEGAPAALRRFVERLRREAPALARVDGVEARAVPTCGTAGFAILDSVPGAARTGIAPDVAVCADCLAELFDPRDRRYRHAFINCTHCGPRFTITRSVPYDRPATSMAGFAMCAACRAEYHDPANRRFHAQPNACPDCGPRVALRDAGGALHAADDPVGAAAAALAAGAIVAVKGLGGYHLACDARRGDAVARLRARKDREEKPFALMALNAASVAGLARVGGAEAALLAARERPVVLLAKRPGADDALAGVAPDVAWLGVMLPGAPLHYLLFHEAAGRPSGTAWLEREHPLLLVMTSANPHGEPIAVDDDEALRRLQGIADAFLMHDRAIVERCDDSVAWAGPGGAPSFLRRARGYVPAPVRLAADGPAVLAVGAHLKNTLCVTRGEEAFVSQHLGDLDNAEGCRAFERAVAHWLHLVGVAPALVARDLHPDLHASRFAEAFAAGRGIRCVAVQHHHAHVASVMAEHGIEDPALGVALDGTGLGGDGSAWGGELLRVGAGGAERIGRLAALALPGGERAAREPWRMAAAALHRMGRGDEIERRWGAPLRAMLERGVRCPPTSSAGRWFDAAAGLLGICERASYEGQAAMRLERLAAGHGPLGAPPDGYRISAGGELDLLPALERLRGERSAARGAAMFHAALVAGLDAWVARAAAATGLRRVVLAGGCFLNRLLADGLESALSGRGLTVLRARALPPNDGGISLGQAQAARWANRAAGD